MKHLRPGTKVRIVNGLISDKQIAILKAVTQDGPCLQPFGIYVQMQFDPVFDWSEVEVIPSGRGMHPFGWRHWNTMLYSHSVDAEIERAEQDAKKHG